MKLIVLLGLMFSISFANAFDAAKKFKDTCTQCHTIGGGDKIGPDLAGVSKRRKMEWIIKFVKYPDGMINGDEEEPGYEKADPLAKALFEAYKPQAMTEQEMSDAEIKAVIKYIDDQKKAPKGKIVKFEADRKKKK